MRHIDIDTGFKHRYLKLWHVAQRQDRASSTRPSACRGKGGEREEGKKKECDNWKQADIYAVCSTSLQATAQAHQQTHIAHILLFQQQQQQGGRGGEVSNGEAKPIQGTNELISRQQAVGAGTESE